MKRIIILGTVCAVVLSSCGTGSKNIATQNDSLSYAIGLDLGNSIKSIDSTVNTDIVAAAMKDVMAGDTTKVKMTQEEAMNFLRNYFTIVKPAKDKEEGVKFLADVEKTNKNVKKTASGLLYEIIESGSAVKPASDSAVVRVTYKGMLKDGKEFDSSRGDTVEFGLNQVIKGWGEGLQLIGEGGKIKLWIPSELGYGAQGAGGAIGPNQPLVFDVELINVVPQAAK